MTFEIINKSSNSGKKENIFVQEVSIDSMDIEYDCKMVENSKFTDDIGIRMKLDIGRDFTPNFYIGGKFKTGSIDGSVQGWGTAYKVKLFFERLGLLLKLNKDKSVKDHRFPEGMAENFVGKKFYRLTYVSKRLNKFGDNYKTDWQQIGDISKPIDNIKEEFMKAVSDGYVKDFLSPSDKDKESDTGESSGMVEKSFESITKELGI